MRKNTPMKRVLSLSFLLFVSGLLMIPIDFVITIINAWPDLWRWHKTSWGGHFFWPMLFLAIAFTMVSPCFSADSLRQKLGRSLLCGLSALVVYFVSQVLVIMVY